MFEPDQEDEARRFEEKCVNEFGQEKVRFRNYVTWLEVIVTVFEYSEKAICRRLKEEAMAKGDKECIVQ
jgi:hypothetical protein